MYSTTVHFWLLIIAVVIEVVRDSSYQRNGVPLVLLLLALYANYLVNYAVILKNSKFTLQLPMLGLVIW